MPKSLGGTAQLRANDIPPINITHHVSHSDPSIPLVSVFSPATWRRPMNSLFGSRHHAPRPRPLLQVYYTAPDAGDPARLEAAARTLETSILAERHQGRDPIECDRLDVYGMPFLEPEGEVVAACVGHQRREIASRVDGKDWYIQRHDLGGCGWRRALIIARKGQEEWVVEDGARREVGLGVVFFDVVSREGRDIRRDVWERRAESVEEEEVLIGELKAELNWQHSASQLSSLELSGVCFLSRV
ncbi:uncharacterized protein F4817DRAFT_366566 [Daldinia loculata]|uniref:uncharacterized protein n=1 Tax=Daldinia loculata TaxID=103429 RepID=UPI0020C28438|nr:uncharacterized protein F4817DRAFT_366566 [Daldinia loculata]KAI1645625.1 hypothetical protein F4817DRAFT_366566 [Daldinia loculata]